jgi:hypothetical protein
MLTLTGIGLLNHNGVHRETYGRIHCTNSLVDKPVISMDSSRHNALISYQGSFLTTLHVI